MAMSIDEQEDGGERGKKRRRTDPPRKRKLVLGDRVEVRSMKEGLLGSWHQGKVVSCACRIRHVEYAHLSNDEGSQKVTELVHVSPVLDGSESAKVDPCKYRGNIRPPPPILVIGPWDLPYGLCVDAYYKNAWWEGVILDHNNGAEMRTVFFPDLGDERLSEIGDIRATQDWDEDSGIWQSRGFWSFLQIIEAVQEERLLPISLEQIWYDLQQKQAFSMLKDWTSPDDSWKDMVLEVIRENLEITLGDIFPLLDSSRDLIEDICPMLEFPELNPDVEILPEADTGGPCSAFPVVDSFIAEKFDHDNNEAHLVNQLVDGLEATATQVLSASSDSQPAQNAHDAEKVDLPIINSFDEPNASFGDVTPHMSPEFLSVLPSELERKTCNSSVASSEASPATNLCQNNSRKSSSTCRTSRNWQPVSSDLLPGAQFYPDAVAHYVKNPHRLRNTLAVGIRKHLLHLGWKVEFLRDDNSMPRQRYCYISPPPHGKRYYSLLLACQDVLGMREEIISPTSGDTNKSSATLLSDPILSLTFRPSQDHDSVGPASSPASHALDVKSVYCPQAVIDYSALDIENSRGSATESLRLNAKMHLSAVGWTFYRSNNRMRYVSPSGKRYDSIRTACRGCIDEDGLLYRSPHSCSKIESATNSKVSESESVRNKPPSPVGCLDIQRIQAPQNVLSKSMFSENIGRSELENIPDLGELKRQGNTGILSNTNSMTHARFQAIQSQMQICSNDNGERLKYNLRPNRSTCEASHAPRSQLRFSDSSVDPGDDTQGSQTVPLLNSSKRVRNVFPQLSKHNPKSILSWLIDNNLVLPRAKVYYRRSVDSLSLAEGRASRDGIKCSCCGNVFSPSGFGLHADANSMGPAAKIFLEDGRSLLECQMQAFLGKRLSHMMKGSRSKMKSSRCKVENDYICSVCHYGGDLMLCDRCPSSFHKGCLGLQDVPDGDWFCPSCCCAVCNQCKPVKDAGCSVDDLALRCDQCERTYHIGCLRMRGVTNLEKNHRKNWYCSKKCEKVSAGLSVLLGKPTKVGVDNLTWTLLKGVEPDHHNVNSPDIEVASGNYIRLNLAIDVMHECFYPVKEPYTKRDLVEDVIFNRGSELNRLNFRGFYTVLLEKDDELISVATVRIYGGKVAELPLVGTRFQYRRLGMCRILMDELEKNLNEIGVEMLVLPAVSGMLNTWITSFGFKKMTDHERSRLLGYTFLDFQGAIMCQKHLRDVQPVELSLPGGNWAKHHEKPDNDADLSGSSTVTENLQTDITEESEILNQQFLGFVSGNGVHHTKSLDPEAVLANFDAGNNLITAREQCSVGDAVQVQSRGCTDGVLRHYHRKRKLVHGS